MPRRLVALPACPGLSMRACGGHENIKTPAPLDRSSTHHPPIFLRRRRRPLVTLVVASRRRNALNQSIRKRLIDRARSIWLAARDTHNTPQPIAHTIQPNPRAHRQPAQAAMVGSSVAAAADERRRVSVKARRGAAESELQLLAAGGEGMGAGHGQKSAG